MVTEVKDRTIHREALITPIANVVAFLVDLLGSRLVAYIAGVKDTKTVRRWANNEGGEVRPDSQQRIRVAYEIAQLLIQVDSPRVVKAWFIGLNPQLDDVSPAEMLHEKKLKEVKTAARAFIAGG